MIAPKVFNFVPEVVIISGSTDTTFVAVGSKVTSLTGGFGFVIAGDSVTGSDVTRSGHVDMARPSQAIPVSHSSSVTTAFPPKKS